MPFGWSWEGAKNGFKGAARNMVMDYNPTYMAGKALREGIINAAHSSDYSDFVAKSNEATDGWYSTIANSVPVVSGIHNAVLNRDSSLDYLNNNGLSWGDVPGYKSNSLTQGTSSGIGSAGRDVGKIAAGIHDLGEFYSGDPSVSAMNNNMYG